MKKAEHRCWSRVCRGSRTFPFPSVYRDPTLMSREEAVARFQVLESKRKRKIRQIEAWIKTWFEEMQDGEEPILPENIAKIRDEVKTLAAEQHKLKSQYPGVDR